MEQWVHEHAGAITAFIRLGFLLGGAFAIWCIFTTIRDALPHIAQVLDDYARCLERDREERRLARLVATGALTPNQARAQLNAWDREHQA